MTIALPLDLVEALIAYLDGDSALLASFGGQTATGRFFSDEMPISAGTVDQFPYMVLSDPDMANEFQSRMPDGTPYWASGQLQVSIFAVGKEQARSLGWAVHDTQANGGLTDVNLTFQRGRLDYLRPTADPRSFKDPEQGPGGVDVWQCVVIFEVAIQRSL